MRLAVNLIPPGAGPLAREAERLGYRMALAPEGVRCDAMSLLGWVAGQTRQIELASGVCQIPARTPALAAMTAATLDELSGGRFRLGLGISNAYFTEAWHGAPFDQPLTRTREYVEIVRKALRREPLTYRGTRFSIPLPGRGLDPFALTTKPVRADLPVFLAAVGPRSLRLAGEIADGWLGVFCSPERVEWSLGQLRAGRTSAGKDLDGFDVIVSAPASVSDDPAAAAGSIAGYVARFVSMGPPQHNSYYRLLASSGYDREAAAVKRAADAGDSRAAAAAVPARFVDETSLVGPVERVADRMRAFARAGVTTLALSPYGATLEAQVATLRLAARALDLAGVGGPAAAVSPAPVTGSR